MKNKKRDSFIYISFLGGVTAAQRFIAKDEDDLTNCIGQGGYASITTVSERLSISNQTSNDSTIHAIFIDNDFHIKELPKGDSYLVVPVNHPNIFLNGNLILAATNKIRFVYPLL